MRDWEMPNLKQGHQEMALLQYDKALRSDPTG